MDQISFGYRAELTRCETIIERGLNTFIEVGNALLEIRDNHLYKDTHKTFEDYCKERWSMNRRYANRLIEASEIVMSLGPIGPKPTHESQVRSLSKLEPEEQRKVWSQAVEESNGHTPTAAVVEQITNSFINTKFIDQCRPPAQSKPIPDIETFKINLARDINNILWLTDPLVERLNQLIKCKDYLDTHSRMDLIKTLENVGERFFDYAKQLSIDPRVEKPVEHIEKLRLN